MLSGVRILYKEIKGEKKSALAKRKITKLFFPFVILTQSWFTETKGSPKKTIYRHIRNIVDPGKSYKIKRWMEDIWQCFIIKIGLTESDMPNQIWERKGEFEGHPATVG